MSASKTDSLQTRESLLSRLRDLGDQESWRVFFDRYWRLLYNVARRSGLDDASAQDIVHETVIAFARKMPEFCYHPERGSFKQWLLRITRRRIVDHLRKVYREPPKANIGPEMLDDDERCSDAAAHSTASQIDRAWN